MPNSPGNEKAALEAFDPKAYMDTVAPMILGALDARYYEGVLANLATAHDMAKAVYAIELDADSCDFAGVFTPMATGPLISQDS